MAEKEAVHAVEVRANAEALKPILAELRAAGTVTGSLDMLRERGRDLDPAAVAVLQRWLPRVSRRDVQMAIVGCLKLPTGRAAAPTLFAVFRDPATEEGVRWSIGDAISLLADDDLYSEISRLVQDRTYGRAREMLALALGRMRKVDATPLLIQLLQDPDVRGHAALALGRRGGKDAFDALEPLLGNERKWIRQAADKSRRQIEKRLKKAEERSQTS